MNFDELIEKYNGFEPYFSKEIVKNDYCVKELNNKSEEKFIPFIFEKRDKENRIPKTTIVREK